jgi:hypothetical protein
MNFMKKKRYMPVLAIMLAGTMLLSSCGSASVKEDAEQEEETIVAVSEPVSAVFDAADLETGWDETATYITLSGDSVSISGSGAEAENTTVTITKAGTYVLSGILNDGQVIVDTEDTDAVRLVLNDADLTCLSSASIYVKSAEKAVLVLADGTENSVTDGTEYVLEDEESDEPNAAVFSKSDLTINGSGTVTVTGNYNNGIQSKDDLKIVSGTILITSVGDGLRGRDYVASGTATSKSTPRRRNQIQQRRKRGRRICSDRGRNHRDYLGQRRRSGGNHRDGERRRPDHYGRGRQRERAKPDRGDFMNMPGNMRGTAPTDGTDTAPTGTPPTGTAPDGNLPTDMQPADMTADQTAAALPETQSTDASDSAADSTAADSAGDSDGGKGIKAGVSVVISGGTLNVDSSDDALHSGDMLTISGGSLQLASGDDGIHSDGTVAISGGEITIEESYEGIEGASISISDGTIDITSDDDGINVAGGNDSSGAAGPFGADNFAASDGNTLQIDGGYLVVDAGGDGIDTNGSAYMTGGTVLVNGPTNSGNGALDYNGEFQIIGGILIAAGSSGMAESPSEASSTQNTVTVTFDAAQQAGTVVALLDESGQCVIAFAPTKQFQTVVFSVPAVQGEAILSIPAGA